MCAAGSFEAGHRGEAVLRDAASGEDACRGPEQDAKVQSQTAVVHVPRVERNALGAVKAVTAASLAIKGDGTHFVPLDACIETMRQTGVDMNEKYKETSTGGLAVNVVEC